MAMNTIAFVFPISGKTHKKPLAKPSLKIFVLLQTILSIGEVKIQEGMGEWEIVDPPEDMNVFPINLVIQAKIFF